MSFARVQSINLDKAMSDISGKSLEIVTKTVESNHYFQWHGLNNKLTGLIQFSNSKQTNIHFKILLHIKTLILSVDFISVC